MAPGEGAGPRDAEILDAVRKYLRQQFRLPAIADDEPLFSSGRLDSFGVLELIVFLEQTFGVQIDTAKHRISDFDTLGSIVSVVLRP